MTEPFRGYPEYRDLWEAAGYRRDMGSAIATKPPGPEYRRLYHLTTAEYAASNLWFGRLKVARLSDLNDPFEFLASTNRIRHGSYKRSLAEKAEADQLYGLLCFSCDWTSPAMWGHYADKHKGICLGFNVRRTLPFKVCYRPRRVEEAQSGQRLPAAPVDINERLGIKSDDWKHEQEWRIILPLSSAQQQGSLHFMPFSADLELAEVILGERCSLPVDAMREKARLQYPQACVFKARLARQHFSVVPDEDTIPRR